MKTEFQVTPGQDELGRMQRDLRFHPVTNPAPAVLTSAQVEQFNRDGYVRGLKIFSAAEIGEIRGYFDALLAKVLAAGTAIRSARRTRSMDGYSTCCAIPALSPVSATCWART
jgi:hypothetical protein